MGLVLRRRRTCDRCFERCAPAVPQHDRPRASTIPLPAHSPCTAASEQSPAAIDPCGDVGCLAGFRQEGSPPYMPCKRYNIKGDTKNWNSLTRYMIRADLDCVFGKSLKCPSSSQRSSFQSPPSRMSLQSTSTSPFAVRVRSSLEPHFDLFTSCSFWSARPPCPNPAHGTRVSRSAPACLRRDGSQHPWCPS